MNKKHIPLIGAIALPIIFIIILALVILVPASKLNPQFDFVYINTGEQYNSRIGEIRFKNTYEVIDQKLVKKELVVSPQILAQEKLYLNQIEYKEAPTLFYYDFETESSREISFEEAQDFVIVKDVTSPDGYTVEFDSTHDGIFEIFGSDNSSGYVIQKDGVKKQIKGLSSGPYDLYRSDLQIIGWVNN